MITRMDEIRVIALIDMDAFYTQVEEREKPGYRGKPLAVIQFSPTGFNGQAIAVNYAARAYGVKRGMDTVEMRKICPIIQLCRVPSLEGIEKGDLTKYRNASNEVFDALENYSEHILVEKASVDEAFLDMTKECVNELANITMEELTEKLIAETNDLFPSTYLVTEEDKQIGNDSEERRIESLKNWIRESCQSHSRQQIALAIGAMLVERIRLHIKKVTQFNCSAGIAHNKVLAKLVCARHKPAAQTIIVPQHLSKLYADTPISSVRNLGGKFGRQLKERFGVKTMADVQHIPHDELFKHFPHNAVWLIQLLEGENDEPISARIRPKSIAVSKNFPGATMLTTVSSVKKWAQGLSAELSKRLMEDQAKYERIAQCLVVGFGTCTNEYNVRTLHLQNYTLVAIRQSLWNFLRVFNKEIDRTGWYPHISFIHMGASRFEATNRYVRKITDFYRPHQFHDEDGSDDIIILADKRKERQPKNDVHQQQNTNGAAFESGTDRIHERVITLSDNASELEEEPTNRAQTMPTNRSVASDRKKTRKITEFFLVRRNLQATKKKRNNNMTDITALDRTNAKNGKENLSPEIITIDENEIEPRREIEVITLPDDSSELEFP